MNEVRSGIGVFDLKPTHTICINCPFMDIKLDDNEVYFDGEEMVKVIKPVCSHIKACMRAFKKGDKNHFPSDEPFYTF